MYSSVISNAVRAGPFDDVNIKKHLNNKNNSLASAGNDIGHKRHRSTTVNSHTNDGKVTVGLSTSSSMRTQMINGSAGEAARMPHLVP